MRIGYFAAKFPYEHWGEKHSDKYSYGGLDGAAYSIAINMAHRGQEINVFTTSIDSKDCIEKYKNRIIYRYGTNFRIRDRNLSFNMFLKSLKNNVDIVHVHTDESILAALFYAKIKKVPVVVTYHGDVIGPSSGFLFKLLVYFHNKLIDRLLFNANIIISPSKHYIGESKFLKKYKDKCIAIPNGIDIEKFNIPYTKIESRNKLKFSLSEKIILFVGTLHKFKGPQVLIKAMDKILKSIPNTKLVFVGKEHPKGYIGELEMLSKKLGIEKHVNFVGFVRDVFRKTLFYKAADVFVLPSTGPEIFGIVNLEAMACSVPIVASKIGGIPDVVKDGENGLLVSPGDSAALADAIIYLLENESVREKMGKNGRKKAEDYSWEEIAKDTEKIYLSLMGQN